MTTFLHAVRRIYKVILYNSLCEDDHYRAYVMYTGMYFTCLIYCSDTIIYYQTTVCSSVVISCGEGMGATLAVKTMSPDKLDFLDLDPKNWCFYGLKYCLGKCTDRSSYSTQDIRDSRYGDYGREVL